MTVYFLPIGLLFALLAGCAPDGVVQGRPYSLTAPADHDGHEPLPLLVLLHGFSANGDLQDLAFPFSRAVNAKRFLYAQPHGTLDARGRRFWNATSACCQPPDSAVNIDDVAYLRAVIEDVKAKQPVDATRVFLVGHSNGGFMALRMACEASDVIAGVVSVAGAASIDASLCTSGTAVPLLQIHGTDDKVIRFGGGSTDYGPYPSAVVTTERLASRNGCRLSSTELPRIDVEAVPGDETRRALFDGCPEGGAVELWTMEGAGHLPAFNDDWTGRAFDWLSEHAR